MHLSFMNTYLAGNVYSNNRAKIYGDNVALYPGKALFYKRRILASSDSEEILKIQDFRSGDTIKGISFGISD